MNFNCPICNGEVEFYDIDPDKKSGRYRCLECGRDTTWKEIKSIKGNELLVK